MCFEAKTQALAEQLKQHVLERVEGPDEAQEMIDEHTKRCNSRISRMAEQFFKKQAYYGIEGAVKEVQLHRKTKLSAIRSAIVLVLKECIIEQVLAEPDELELVGTGLLFDQPAGALVLS